MASSSKSEQVTAQSGASLGGHIFYAPAPAQSSDIYLMVALAAAVAVVLYVSKRKK